MSCYVLVAYGYVFAPVTSAVLVLFLERKKESKLTLPICLKIFLLGLLGVLARILFFAGLKNTAAAFAAAIINLIPSVTFLFAILCRMEKLDIFKLSGQAKIGGTTVAFGGATIMNLYKGITVLSFQNQHTKHTASNVLADKNLIKGSFFLVLHCLTAAVFYILQTSTLKNYPAPIALTSWTSIAGTIIGTTLAVNYPAPIALTSWKLSWDLTLVAPLYTGIVSFAISIYMQTLVIQEKGPVFFTAFQPLTAVIVAIMGLLLIGEALHFGGLVGATMIIFGLYAILWGKEDEKKKRQLGPVSCDQEIEIKADRM